MDCSVHLMWEYIPKHEFSGYVERKLRCIQRFSQQVVGTEQSIQKNFYIPISEKRSIIALFRMAIEQDIKMLDAVKVFKTKKYMKNGIRVIPFFLFFFFQLLIICTAFYLHPFIACFPLEHCSNFLFLFMLALDFLWLCFISFCWC